MQIFSFITPTNYVYGVGAELQTGALLSRYGQKTLVVCNQSDHLLNSEVFDRILDSIKMTGVEPFFLKGILPNPRLEKVKEGIDLCRLNGIKAIHYSKIDSANAIKTGIFLKI